MTVIETKVYTDSVDFNSSVLDIGYYNENTKNLFLDLHSGTRVGYVGVPNYIWEQFVDSNSPGRFWNVGIKGFYESQCGDVNLKEFFRDSPQGYEISVTIEGTITITGKTSEHMMSSSGALKEFLTTAGVSGDYTVKEVRHFFNN